MITKTSDKVLWWLCLFIAPATLIAIELFHPAGFTKDPGMFQFLTHPHPFPGSMANNALGYPGPQWWFVLHMIQTPTVILVAGGLWLAGGLQNPKHDPSLANTLMWIARICLFVFVVYYTVLDAIGGIGLGRTLLVTEALQHSTDPTKQLTPEQVAGVQLLLNEIWVDPWVGGVGSFVSLTGSWAIFFATLFTAPVLYLRKLAPVPALVLLVVFGYVLQESHASYYGPLAFTILLVTGLIMWRHLQTIRSDTA